jgi:2-polyprenyl-6-methoxyphenol hydroxylase-like FAD-dependent oxidoreductase
MIEQSEVSGIPVNDVPMPEHAAVKRGRGFSVRLGDALVPVRLQVGAGLNQGLHQAADLAGALGTGLQSAVACWDQIALSNLAKVVEQGRSRAHRNNLGWYLPVRPGKTTAPADDQWADPKWVTA